MAFPRLWNPGMGGLVQDQPTKLRLPMPGYKDPYSGAGLGKQLPPSGPQVPEPRWPQPQLPGQPTAETSIPQSVASPAPKLEVSPFMTTIYKSIQNIDPEQRSEYLSTTASSIKDRLDRYEFRIARGIPLTSEQQRQYDSIKSAYNDIQRYMNNQSKYDDFFSGKLVKVLYGLDKSNG